MAEKNLESVFGKPLETPPEGGVFTTRELAHAYGWSRSHAGQKIHAAITAGDLEYTGCTRRCDVTGREQAIPVYRVTKKPRRGKGD